MVTATTVPKARRPPLHGFEQAVERVLHVDGMEVPMGGVSVVIALLLGFAASRRAVGALIAIEVAVLGVVLLGFVGVLNEDADNEGEAVRADGTAVK